MLKLFLQHCITRRPHCAHEQTTSPVDVFASQKTRSEKGMAPMHGSLDGSSFAQQLKAGLLLNLLGVEGGRGAHVRYLVTAINIPQLSIIQTLLSRTRCCPILVLKWEHVLNDN
ncbi:hypothetical protein PsorP6_006789 [Peronosclerospora sorghi]|uniref:Uncharacterized protein n=1 Tax=Peronosclerospora sorghi TaxID=230839 RepID=A0ACC0W2J8_9STRA|nr:hypothetical protein PsorP6_006789 [Peronosclerospora sorghi]